MTGAEDSTRTNQTERGPKDLAFEILVLLIILAVILTVSIAAADFALPKIYEAM